MLFMVLIILVRTGMSKQLKKLKRKLSPTKPLPFIKRVNLKKLKKNFQKQLS
jgi:hypothetical protein